MKQHDCFPFFSQRILISGQGLYKSRKSEILFGKKAGGGGYSRPKSNLQPSKGT